MTYDLINNIHGNKSFPIVGKNPDGESVIIEKGEDFYKISTCQQNGWIRIMTYHKDGTVEEEYTK